MRSFYEVYIIPKKSQSFACCGKLNKVEGVHVDLLATMWAVACENAVFDCLAEETLLLTHLDLLGKNSPISKEISTTILLHCNLSSCLFICLSYQYEITMMEGYLFR